MKRGQEKVSNKGEYIPMEYDWLRGLVQVGASLFFFPRALDASWTPFSATITDGAITGHFCKDLHIRKRPGDSFSSSGDLMSMKA